jgi:hypothetical protein
VRRRATEAVDLVRQRRYRVGEAISLLHPGEGNAHLAQPDAARAQMRAVLGTEDFGRRMRGSTRDWETTEAQRGVLELDLPAAATAAACTAERGLRSAQTPRRRDHPTAVSAANASISVPGSGTDVASRR